MFHFIFIAGTQYEKLESLLELPGFVHLRTRFPQGVCRHIPDLITTGGYFTTLRARSAGTKEKRNERNSSY